MTGQAHLPENLPADASGPVALAYILAHDKRVVFLDGLRLRTLKETWLEGMSFAGMTSLMGGPDDHDSLVSYIADQEFPDMTRARKIHYEWVLSQQPALGQE